MNIKQLSANIDQKLALLEQQISSLQIQSKLADPTQNHEQIAKDLEALVQLRNKLIKSRDIAWKAHNLQRESDEKLMQRKRWLGIALCVISGLGLLIIAWVVLTR